MARAWVELMKRLGYTQFVAQGGDWGAVVTDVMAAQAPPELLGMHTNMPGVIPPEVAAEIRFVTGAPAPAGLSAEEVRCWEQVNFLYTKGVGYAVEMATQPQTLYGVADSPVGLAAWMINHDAASYSDIADAFAVHSQRAFPDLVGRAQRPPPPHRREAVPPSRRRRPHPHLRGP
jgi:pimeloyl-ACP methyl ester carboxylesterase